MSCYKKNIFNGRYKNKIIWCNSSHVECSMIISFLCTHFICMWDMQIKFEECEKYNITWKQVCKNCKQCKNTSNCIIQKIFFLKLKFGKIIGMAYWDISSMYIVAFLRKDTFHKFQVFSLVYTIKTNFYILCIIIYLKIRSF